MSSINTASRVSAISSRLNSDSLDAIENVVSLPFNKERDSEGESSGGSGSGSENRDSFEYLNSPFRPKVTISSPEQAPLLASENSPDLLGAGGASYNASHISSGADTVAVGEIAFTQAGISGMGEVPASFNGGMMPSEPILLDKAVTQRIPSKEELGEAAERAQLRLDQGDRAGAYLEIYKVTGNEQLLLQAQISTYSGAVGGMALEGNYRAKMADPDNYTVTLDQFSVDIDQAVVELATKMARADTPEQYTTINIMRVDAEVWDDQGLGEHFPGNAQFIGIEGYEERAESPGSEIAILAQDEIELGKRPAEYANDPRFATTTSEDGRFVTVVNNETNRIEVFFDNDFDSDAGSTLNRSYAPDLEQIENNTPSTRIAAERQMKMEFVQAGVLAPSSELPSFDAGAVRPPENLDRVFEFEGALYQSSDELQLEKHGVDISALTRDDGYKVFGEERGNGIKGLLKGAKFGRELNEAGVQVEKVVEGKYWFDSNRERDFQNLINEGIVKPLTGAETEYYKNAVESVGSPYQSTDDAMKQLGNNLAWPIMYLGDNDQGGNNTDANA